MFFSCSLGCFAYPVPPVGGQGRLPLVRLLHHLDPLPIGGLPSPLWVCLLVWGRGRHREHQGEKDEHFAASFEENDAGVEGQDLKYLGADSAGLRIVVVALSSTGGA